MSLRLTRKLSPRWGAGPGPSAEGPTAQVYIGRQAVLDTAQRVAGYELLYRKGSSDKAHVVDQEDATANVAAMAIAEFGLDRLTPRVPAFINVTADFLISRRYEVLPKDRVVLELVEDQHVDAGLRMAIKDLRRNGYRLALDDFIAGDVRDDLVELAHIVKVDLPALQAGEAQSLCSEIRRRGAIPLAEKVEAPEDYVELRRAGFALFQGFFFERPILVAGRALRADRLALLQLYSELQDPEFDVGEAASIVRRDIELTYRMLRLVNSAAFGLSKPVDDVRDAVVVLGLNTLRNITALLSLTRIDTKPTELTMVAMVRAKMCEELADAAGAVNKDAAFTVGLLSVLDGFFDSPLTDILEELPLSGDVRDALLHRNGRLGEILDVVIAYEHGDLERLAHSELRPASGLVAYTRATQWAESVRDQLTLGR